MNIRINTTLPEVIISEDATLVGIQMEEYYSCTCYDSEYHHSSVISSNSLNAFNNVDISCGCLNGGVCSDVSDASVCSCPNNNNYYGPKCELLEARIVQGYSWFKHLDTCEDSTLSVSFSSDEPQGMLLYNGPILAKPYAQYPKDFVYMILDGNHLTCYLELGSGTMELSVEIEQNNGRTMIATLSWNSQKVNLEVNNCGNYTSSYRSNICRNSTPLIGNSFLFNTGGPLQLGGMAAMPSLNTLAQSYDWTLTPKSVPYFSGCFSRLQFNDYIYDMNSTDYYKNFYRTCSAVSPLPIVQLGAESIIIIVASLALLLRELQYYDK